MTPSELLDLLSKVAPVVSACIAIVAAIFISRQIANIRRNREVDTLIKIITLSDNAEMREARNWLTFELNEEISIDDVINDREITKKFSNLIHLFTTMGVLVNNKYIPEKLIFDKYGLLIIGAWGKLEPLIKEMKMHLGSNEYAENFETLANKYNVWAKKQPLKIKKQNAGRTKAGRMKLEDGKSFLDYSRSKL